MRRIGVEYEAAMRGRTRELVFSVALLGFASGIAIRARGAAQAPAAEQPLKAIYRSWATGRVHQLDRTPQEE